MKLLLILAILLTGCTTIEETPVVQAKKVAAIISKAEGTPGEWKYRALLIRTPEDKVVLVVDLWPPFREGDKSMLQFRRQLRGNLRNRAIRFDYGQDSLDVEIDVIGDQINIETLVDRGIKVITY